jgi:hypothetical protein
MKNLYQASKLRNVENEMDGAQIIMGKDYSSVLILGRSFVFLEAIPSFLELSQS